MARKQREKGRFTPGHTSPGPGRPPRLASALGIIEAVEHELLGDDEQRREAHDCLVRYAREHSTDFLLRVYELSLLKQLISAVGTLNSQSKKGTSHGQRHSRNRRKDG